MPSSPPARGTAKRQRTRTRSSRDRQRLAVAVFASAILVSGCSTENAGPPDPDSPVTGLITAVKGSIIEVATGGEKAGRTLTFEVADPSVSMQHLDLHRSERLPVTVHFERRDNRLVATLVADAGG